MNIVRNPLQFQGLAHDENARSSLGLRGLLPAAVRPADLQVELVLYNVRNCETDLGRYMLLREMQDTNERLFYRVLSENVEEIMPYVYTPVVGQVCMQFSRIFRRPRGLFITINDFGCVYDILSNWPERNIRAIVVTDGERILGLGDLGANGMAIPIGKLSLYTAADGISPSSLLPVTLDVGTNNADFLDDPFYIGLKQNRLQGAKYDEFVDEFMEAVVKMYGETCLVQFEDFGNQNAFRLLEKYKSRYCTFNDDIQGTASVTVAGILSSVKLINTEITNHTFLFYGAGQAVLGIAEMLVSLLQDEGISTEDAYGKIWIVDSKGLVVKSRESSELTERKKRYAKDHPPTTDLEKIVNHVKPSVLIGASAQFGAFTEKVLKTMLKTCKEPIVFALSNPTEKAECTAEQAYTFTDGRCTFASGTAFPPFTYKRWTFPPNQVNNVYIFPGVALAITACETESVDDKVFLVAAKALAEQVSREDMAEGRIFPLLNTIRKVSLRIAVKVAHFLYHEGFATYKPQPDDFETFITSKQYDYDYTA